ncbi:MAG: hypothetical protein AB199_03855 [Parcubacteria bacterium C7867-004]|nr:MAG: hypothetical protein AB199_03855 [Parcubacteria bacterium C7867-004]
MNKYLWIIAALVAIVFALGGYVMYEKMLPVPTTLPIDAVQLEPQAERKDAVAAPSQPSSITRDNVNFVFTSAPERDGNPYTNVHVLISGKNAKEYDAGTFEGSCWEMDARGGIDGSGLLPGEVAAAQCWFGGAGDEVGVFSTSAGAAIRLGELGEGDPTHPFFRGNFKVLYTL